MSVMPGFGGQQFERSAIDKLRQLKVRTGPGVLLAVDGGINSRTIADCAAAGADGFVVGSGIFNHEDYAEQVATLRDLAMH